MMTKDDHAEDIEASHAELDFFGTDRAQDSITNLYMALHDDTTFGRLVRLAIRMEVESEAAYRAEKDAEGIV